MIHIKTLLSPNRVMVLATAALLIAGAVATAADIEPSKLSVNKARGFLGEWVLAADIAEGETMHLSVNFVNINGKLGATVQYASAPKAIVVTDISESSMALKLRYMSQVGETEVPMSLILRLGNAGTISGSLEDDMMSEGTEGRGALGLGLFAARINGQKGGKIPGRALLTLGEGSIRVTYGTLTTGSPDHVAMADVKDGEIVRFTRSRSVKLFTDFDLAFGDHIIKTENSGAGYPGVYSLWLKKVKGGWNLVFNSEPDIWGTMHNPEKDVAEVPLGISSLSEEESRLSVDLLGEGQGGVLRVAWGKNEWKTPFTLAQ